LPLDGAGFQECDWIIGNHTQNGMLQQISFNHVSFHPIPMSHENLMRRLRCYLGENILIVGEMKA